MSNGTNKKGSLILEALLSIVILSVAITFILQSMTASLRASVYSSDYTTALILLENKMAEILKKDAVVQGLKEEQSLAKPFDKYNYGVETKVYTDEEVQGLNEIDMYIFWKDSRKKNRVRLMTLSPNLTE